jgi:hypothetical protein
MLDFLRRNLPFAPKGNTSMPVTLVKPKKGKTTKAKAVEKPSAPIPILDIGHSYHYDELTRFTTRQPFRIDSKDFLKTGERDAVLASSGMGKSFLTGVILEEILEKSNQVLFIIDPESEWYTLIDRYNNDERSFVVFGKKGPKYKQFPVHLRFAHDADAQQIQDDINAFEMKMAPIIRALISGAVSCVFDTSLLGTREKEAATAVICEAIFKGENNLEDDDDGEHLECRKVRVVLDEAHTVAPQNPQRLQHLSLEAIEKIAKRGRKRNIHMLLATQTPASVNKEVLKQCNRYWLGCVTSQLDYKANKSIYESAGLKLEDVQKLGCGYFIYSCGLTVLKIRSRERHCKHGGATKKESARPVMNREQAEELLAGLL